MTAKKEKVRTFIFNFKKEFAADVESGKKLQTVRSLRADGRVPRDGEIVKLFTGLRTKGARLLLTSTVLECFPIHMDLMYPRSIIANGVRLSKSAADDFARADGFANATEMFAWFGDHYGMEFEGFCVKWRVSK